MAECLPGTSSLFTQSSFADLGPIDVYDGSCPAGEEAPDDLFYGLKVRLILRTCSPSESVGTDEAAPAAQATYYPDSCINTTGLPDFDMLMPEDNLTRCQPALDYNVSTSLLSVSFCRSCRIIPKYTSCYHAAAGHSVAGRASTAAKPILVLLGGHVGRLRGGGE